MAVRLLLDENLSERLLQPLAELFPGSEHIGNLTKAGTTDPEKVAATLRSQPWETIIGKLAFDAKGDLTSSTYVWYVFKDGKYTEAGM